MGFNAEIMTAVNYIDLQSVRQKFLANKGWWWRLWNGYRIEDIEEDYREFLYLIATNPGETIVPWSQEMDDFWHEHILDTRKYQKDCKSLGVEAIHHNPNLPKGSYRHSMGVQATKQARAESGVSSRSTDSHTSSYVGCAAYSPWLYSSPAAADDCPPSSHHDSSHSPCDHSSHSDSSSSHSDSSSHSSCGGSSSDSGSSSCGGSSCGGSSCGGGGGD